MTTRPRPGVTLAELLVAFALGGIVATALAGVLRAQENAVRRQSGQAADAAAQRIAAAVLGAELRALRPDTDLRGIGRDSLALRVFRGAAVVCGRDGDIAVVRYRGLRLPDPDKDSVLIVGGQPEPAVPLEGSGDAGPDACNPAAGERLMRWSLDPPPPTGRLLLLFESGSYHLTDDAFRYRRGRSGRQPLTDERLDTDASSLRGLTRDGADAGSPADVAAVELLLRPLPGPGVAADAPLRLRVPLPNATP